MTSARISTRFGALWVVAAALVCGLVVVAAGQVRAGGFIVTGAMSAAALFRLVLPAARAGGLVVRSRTADVLFLLVMAVALFGIVIALDLGPRV